MPFIRFELDAMECVPDAAQLAGVPEGQFGWGLTKMWRQCWRWKTDTLTTDHLAGLFGGDGVRVGVALERFGFAVDQQGGRYRIRGAEKYLRVSKARSKGGAKGGKKTQELRSVQANPKQTRSKSEALTASSEQRAASSEQVAAPAPASRPRALTEALCADFTEATTAKYAHQGAKDGDALSWLMAQAGDEEIRARWRRGLRAPDKDWKHVATFAQLRQKWNDLAAVGSAAAPIDIKRGRVGAEQFYPPPPGKAQPDGGMF